MHSRVRQHNKRTTIHSQPYTILPQRLHIKAKAAQDSRAGNFNVEAVLVVDEAEVLYFVDDEAFEGVVEDG
jgi:uncharacterized protein YkuJ